MSQSSHQLEVKPAVSLSAADRLKRLEYLNFSEHDEELLKALRPVFENEVVPVVDAFYEHLLGFPEAKRLLANPGTLERLKKIQIDYLLRLTAGNYDEAYVQDRLRVGQAHERAGLSLQWYVGGYSVYTHLLAPRIARFCGHDLQRTVDTMLALAKIFAFDLGLAMDAYMASDRYRHLQQFESIVRDSADAIFLLDMDTRFRAWNSAAERIFGWRSDEILGQPLTVLMPEDARRSGELERINRQVMATGHVRLETVRLAKSGRRVPVEVTVSLLRDPQGNPIGRSAILRDITERKRLEEGKLQAERLALVGTMSAKLAHEIRNPLSSIGLNLDLLKDEINGLERVFRAVCPGQETSANENFHKSIAEATELSRSIHMEVHRIRNVLEDYLKFARLPKIRLERLSLNELLQRHLAFMKPTFDSSRVEVETDLDPGLPDIEADDEQLWQAILNVIRNSLEAMPGGGRLKISTRSASGNVRLEIADSGTGMSAETMQNVFAPFFSTKRGGTGLGMPLTLQIVTEHGGTIQCESAGGSGTAVTITCPCASG